jgi:ribosomal protein S16
MAFKIKLIPKGKKRSKNFDIVVMHYTKGLHGRVLSKLGVLVKEQSHEAFLTLDKKKLHFWLKKGAEVPVLLKKYLEHL